MTTNLYKVSAPQADNMFYPGAFWHTPDWESSTTRFREGYIRDEVLYAGDFDEVNIHLFPRVRTVRVRSVDCDEFMLRDLGFKYTPGKTAHIFIHRSCKQAVESFHPTIYKFNMNGFVHIRKGEYVSWESQSAISSETITIDEAVMRWNVQTCYVDDVDNLIARLKQVGIYFDEQT